jgi:hypothetical protein
MKKDSQTIHREKAEKKNARDRKRKAGYKGKSYSEAPKKQDNPYTHLSIERALAVVSSEIMAYHRKKQGKQRKSYQRRKV